MQTALYIIWFLLPTFFFVMALWSKLEQLGHSNRKQNPGDFFKQGLFVLACVFIAVLIDQYILPSAAVFFNSEWLPLGFLQAILLPVVLFLAAKWIGPTNAILISKAPKTSNRRRR